VLKKSDEKGGKTRIFRQWNGPNCLVDALKDGIKDGGTLELPQWTGTGEFASGKATQAVFQLVRFDRDVLEPLVVDADVQDPKEDYAKTCVEPVSEER
jgi:hypothetical protein